MSALLPDIDATCASLGYLDGDVYRLEPEAIQNLKHLIWILRRDNEYHEYRRHLGESKVLQTDLLPILIHLKDDRTTIDISDVLLRLLVNLTNPTMLLYREEIPKDEQERHNYLVLIEILQGYKEAFSQQEIWSVLGKRLQLILEIDWAERSEEQGLIIERILVLTRNVLQVPASPESERRTDNDASIHDQVLWALHRSDLLDIILFIIGSEYENQYHLHALEIICLIFREQTAASLADASLQRSTIEKQQDEQELLVARRREKYKMAMHSQNVGRHSRFGGTFVIQNIKSLSDNPLIYHQSLQKTTDMDFNREKTKQKRSHRIAKDTVPFERRSAFSVRLFLREFCIEILCSAYNVFIRRIRGILERNTFDAGHDDSYLLWAIRFFMEFNRLSDFQLHLISESLSVPCFHWIITRIQHDMEMMLTDKKKSQQWSKRLHIAVQTYREILLNLIELQKVNNEDAQELYKMLLNTVCYVLEYRETVLQTILHFNETHSTKSCLRDIIELVHIFFKIMESFCKGNVVVQQIQKRKSKKSKRKSKKNLTNNKKRNEPEYDLETLENLWKSITSEISVTLSNGITLPEHEHPLPFDAVSEKPMDEQKDDCMIKINNLLRKKKYEHAIILMRSAREVWPEHDCFGSITVSPEDELELLHDIYITNLGSDFAEGNNNDHDDDENGGSDNNNNDDDDDNDDNDEDDEEGENGLTESDFRFEDFAKRLVNPKVVRACVIVLSDWDKITTRTLKSTVTILHRIAFECKMPAMLFQASLFRIFQRVFASPIDKHSDELRRLAIYIIRKFTDIAPSNPKIYAELLFYKNVREATELEYGYDQDSNNNNNGKKGAGWSEEQELELRQLYIENQRNPATDQDVIDWIADNLIDKSRTRRAIIRKLKELGLIFKAPTKKTTASAVSKYLWTHDEDEKLKQLYDEYRLDNAICLMKLMEEFGDKRSKSMIIKRMITIGLISDASDIVPARKGKKSNNNKKSLNNENTDDDDDNSSINSSSDDDNNQNILNPQAVAKRKPKSTNKQRSSSKKSITKLALNSELIKKSLSELNDSDFESVDTVIQWLIESLTDAAEDITNDPDGDDSEDGVPLVPYTIEQRSAFDNDIFKRVLLALGLKEPVEEMEIYWRIPISLTANDILTRVKILSGEDVPLTNNTDPNPNDSVDVIETGAGGGGGAGTHDEFNEKINQTMNHLLYNESDDDDDEFDFNKYVNKKPSSNEVNKKIVNSANENSGNENIENGTDEFDINTEDLRKRLACLINSDDSDNNTDDNDITVSNKLSKKKRRKPNAIESDDDDNDEINDDVNINDEQNLMNENQMKINTEISINGMATLNNTKTNSKKRELSSIIEDESDNGDDDDNVNTHGNISRALESDEEFGDDLNLVMHKSKNLKTSNKKRRIVISDDDDD